MSDQRSAFRFRVPRLRPSIPPPQSTTTTSQTRTRRPPIQPQPQPSPLPSPPVRPPAPLDPPVIPSPEPAPPPISASAPEPYIETSTVPETQDERAPAPPSPPESTKTEPQTGIQSEVSSHPPSPSTRSQPTSQPASPPISPPRLASKQVKKTPSLPSSPVLTETKTIPEEPFPIPDTELSNSSESQTETENKPEVKRSTEMNQAIDSNFNEEKHEDISTTTNIPDTPQTKSMISDTVRASESPQNLNSITEPQAPHHEETTAQKPVSVITFAGDNRGTSINIGVNKRERAIHIRRRYKVNPDEITDTLTDGEESSKENKSENDLKAVKNQGENAYINCNIQGINNSMVFNCSITEKNPGVHLGSSSNPYNVTKPKTKNTNLTNTKKVKVKITPSQKVTYEPTIRRRCLGGLFMDSSDSDPDNPEKPRHHGCRYTIGEKSNKDDKIYDR